MKFRHGWDGLPRDLPLSRAERARMWSAAWKEGEAVSVREWWVALVPAGVMLAGMLVWLPLVWWQGSGLPFWVRMTLAFVIIAASFPVQMALVRRATWRRQCGLMARAGYEVCPACAFPLEGVGREQGVCTECGAERVAIDRPGASR